MTVSGLDFTLGLRMLRRYPGITVLSTVAMAVAIALAMLYVEGLQQGLHPTLPAPDAERLVAAHYWDLGKHALEERTLDQFAAARGRVRTLDHLGAAIPFSRNLMTENHGVEPVRGAEVTANAFTLMGVTPLLGRPLTARDEQPTEPLAVVIGEQIWTRQFERDPSIVGRSVKVGTADATIVGVMPERFGFPNNQRLWLPLRADGSLLAPRTGPRVTIFGRLAPGVSIAQAQAELDGISAGLAATDREAYANLRPQLSRFGAPPFEGDSPVFTKVLYAVNMVFLLLLAVICTNVATLVFARTATRAREVAVRSAIGASRGRIVWQLFTEALVLAVVAAGLGTAAAKLALRWGVHGIGRDRLPFWVTDSLSPLTLLYGGLLAVVAAAIVGILPALRVTRLTAQDALRREAGAGASLRFGGVWTTVIVTQVAITVALIPIAGILVIASNRFQQRAEAVNAEHYLSTSLTFERGDAAAEAAAGAVRVRQSIEEFERRLRGEPGVEEVAFADVLPVDDQSKAGVELDTSNGAPADGQRFSVVVHVSPGYFATFGTSVIAGRDFSPTDVERGNVVIVNEWFTRLVLHDRNPIGQRIRLAHGEIGTAADDGWYEVIGMVRNIGWQPDDDRAAVYHPVLPAPGQGLNMAVRARDPLRLAPRLRAIAVAVNPDMQLVDVKPMTEVGGGATLLWTLSAVAGVIAFMVLLLSASGIHALMSFIVARRTREIGIRVALGSSPRQIVSGIFRRAFLQVVAGIAVGCAVVSLRIDFSSPTQVLYLVVPAIVMLIAALLACAVPLRRALRVNPTEALRAEA